LFNIVQPHLAFFGEKDMQQLAVIRRMTSDLNLPITVVGVATVRESDGLAVSSRNQYLDAEQRQAAPVLFRALQQAVLQVQTGEQDVKKIREAAISLLEENPLVRIEYLEVVDPDEIQPVSAIRAPVRIAAAIWVGSTRLIDNILARPATASAQT
jgi:pantoate--beta-alanine ligase